MDRDFIKMIVANLENLIKAIQAENTSQNNILRDLSKADSEHALQIAVIQEAQKTDRESTTKIFYGISKKIKRIGNEIKEVENDIADIKFKMLTKEMLKPTQDKVDQNEKSLLRYGIWTSAVVVFSGIMWTLIKFLWPIIQKGIR